MKYLKKFDTEEDLQYVRANPNLILINNTKKVLYNVPVPNGVYIQHISGVLYTKEEWQSEGYDKGQANGVAVITDNAKFVVAKNSYENVVWSSNSTDLVEGATVTTNNKIEDYNGKANTDAMLMTDVSGAAYTCVNYSFPNGSKGYLPALGELRELYKNKAKAVSALNLIDGGVLFPASFLWSSTQYSAVESWGLKGYSDVEEGYRNQSKSTGYYVRPFTTLEL